MFDFKKFLLHDIWRIEDIKGAKNFFLKELQILILEIKLFYKNNALSKASSLAYTTMLSLIPVLAILFMIFKTFGGKDFLDKTVKPFIYEYLTVGTGDKISVYLDSFLNSATVETLGSIGVIFLAIAVYSILSSVELNFNEIWNVKKNRSLIEQIKSYLLTTIVTPILIVLSFSVTSKIKTLTGLGETFLVTQIIPFVFILILFLIVLITIPNCKVYANKAITGAVYGTMLFFISKSAFIYYTKMTVSYNIIYGSIAILPLLMIWIYFIWIIILLSVQISYVRQNIYNLKMIEKSSTLNRLDRIRIAIMICMKIIDTFIKKKKKLSVLDLSIELNVPVLHIRDIISDLEKSELLIEITNEQDIYTVNTPLKEFTLSKVIEAVDRKYLDSYYIFSNEDIFSKIIKNDNIDYDMLNLEIQEMLKFEKSEKKA